MIQKFELIEEHNILILCCFNSYQMDYMNNYSSDDNDDNDNSLDDG